MRRRYGWEENLAFPERDPKLPGYIPFPTTLLVPELKVCCKMPRVGIFNFTL